MTTPTVDRRQLLAGAGTAAVAALASHSGVAAGLLQPSPLALLDGALGEADRVVARRMLAPLEPRLLQHDLVWEWRGELARELARGRRLIAITRWDKAMLLSGLARESGLAARQHRIGRSAFRTQIG